MVSGHDGIICPPTLNKCFKRSFASFVAFNSFEVLSFIITGPAPLLCILVYRLSRYHNFTTGFSEVLSVVLSKDAIVIILGDFNNHICCPSNPMPHEFIDLAESFNLVQSVKEPTHSKGHILHLVVSYDFCPDNIDIVVVFIVDHRAVIFNSLFCLT